MLGDKLVDKMKREQNSSVNRTICQDKLTGDQTIIWLVVKKYNSTKSTAAL